MRTALRGVVWILAGWVVPVLLAQATLPSVVTGPWQRGTPPVGWTFSGLGGDYTPGYDGLQDGAAKLDGTGDFIEISYSGSAASVSFWIQGNTFSGGTFTVEESLAGGVWTPLQTYTSPPSPAVFQSLTPLEASRFIRFIYTLDAGGNVGLDGVSILSEAALHPEFSDISAGLSVDVTVLKTVLGRTYDLEYAPALDSIPLTWTHADSGTGTVGPLLLQDSLPENEVRFYRIRDVTP
jgi:hypothetical protein